MLFRKLNIVFLLCAVTLLGGCASFSNKEIADVGNLPDVSHYRHKPTAYVDFHFYRGMPGDASPAPDIGTAIVQGIVKTSMANSGLFSKYSFKPEDKADSDYTLTVNVYDYGSRTVAMISGFISGVSLGIIPGRGTDHYLVEVKLADKSGEQLSSLSNHDSVTTWVGLWFIPFGSSPKKAVTGTLDNQIKALLKELVESGKLKYSFTQVTKHAALA